uniref:Uncharacterized protein n=1 Tax=Glossina pallidipes TaxID=7398 RepID=A0A1A9ZNJ6_GLOPL
MVFTFMRYIVYDVSKMFETFSVRFTYKIYFGFLLLPLSVVSSLPHIAYTLLFTSRLSSVPAYHQPTSSSAKCNVNLVGVIGDGGGSGGGNALMFAPTYNNNLIELEI